MRNINLDELHAEKMKKLRHVVLHGLCDNQMLSILGQGCTTLQYLDITGSTDVTDLGIQNLVFPLSIQKAGRVNLVNTRARTNPPAKQLHTVMARQTGVDTTGRAGYLDRHKNNKKKEFYQDICNLKPNIHLWTQAASFSCSSVPA